MSSEAAIEAMLLDWLETSPDGLSEHALLKRLQAAGLEAFPDALFRDSLSLFRAHFLLFHLLYRLRDRVGDSQRYLLDIHPLRICLRPYAYSTSGELAEHDPLRLYYLDLEHLHTTTAQQVEALLGGFWARLYARQRRHQALAVLDLAEPVDDAAIRLRYRRLAMEHHPDRGGDKERFQAVQEAMEILRRC